MALKTFAAISIGSAVTEMKIFEFTSRRVMKEVDWISTRRRSRPGRRHDGSDQQPECRGTLPGAP